MPYQYKMMAQKDFLRVEVSGHRSEKNIAAEAIELWTTITVECRKQQLNKILAIFDVAGQRTMMDTFDIVEGVLDLNWPEAKVAYVESNIQHKEANLMAETTAQMHGIAFQTFLCEETASQWLLSD